MALQIIETAMLKMPTDLNELCKEKCNNIQNKNDTLRVKPVDCSDIYQSGEHRDGIYDIWPQGRASKSPLMVYCDMASNGGGWTVIQRRGDYKNPKDYFYRGWNSYKTGFGDKLKDFWIGNDNLFSLTNQRSYHLRINLTDWDENSTYALYDKFRISDESFDYTLHVKGYKGTAGHSLETSNGEPFQTKERDNGRFITNCADERGGAWWYQDCGDSNLNGMYLGKDERKTRGIIWATFRGFNYSLKETVMKIRPAGFNSRSAE